MTFKNTILISAATYFVLNFILWATGWMIWPILWIICGHLCVLTEKHDKYAAMPNFACYAGGPISLMVSVMHNQLYKNINIFKHFPKIRNPFIWPEKELDKQEDKE